jgi:hypothetical protein
MNEQQQRDLAAGLQALANSTRETNASPHIEAAVLAAMDRVPNLQSGAPNPDCIVPSPDPRIPNTEHRTPSTEYRVPVGIRLLPLAAALVLAVGGALWTIRDINAPKVVHPAGFVALPGAVWLPELESATIVRVSLPVTALPGYGVAIQPDVLSDAVLAELLVAQDGQPRAIRLVSDSD